MKRTAYLLATLALLAAMSLSQVSCRGYSGVAAAGPAYGGIAYDAAPWGAFLRSVRRWAGRRLRLLP
jgi:hypothetical protein